MAIREQVTPLAGKGRVQHIERSVDGEEPHKKEVPRHAFRQTVTYVERAVEPFREELEKRHATESDAINVIRPVDQRSAPDHHRQQGKVDPMEPANRQRMFFLQSFHSEISSNSG